MQNPSTTNPAESRPDYVAIGFDQIGRDLRLLVDCLAEVLEEIGEAELARFVPWRDRPIPDAAQLPPRLGLVYSIAFQLLNMVEECAAARMRTLREEAEGPAADVLLPEVLLSVNAIASGLRTTG